MCDDQKIRIRGKTFVLFPGGSLVGLSNDRLWVMDLPQNLPTSTHTHTTAADLATKAGTFLEDS